MGPEWFRSGPEHMEKLLHILGHPTQIVLTRRYVLNMLDVVAFQKSKLLSKPHALGHAVGDLPFVNHSYGPYTQFRSFRENNIDFDEARYDTFKISVFFEISKKYWWFKVKSLIFLRREVLLGSISFLFSGWSRTFLSIWSIFDNSSSLSDSLRISAQVKKPLSSNSFR